jgi:uncharacterized membrane protein YfcA
MLLEIWRSAPYWLLIAILASLVIAGWLKGVIGVGMPIIALPLLSMLIDVRASVMLLSVPLVLSNIPQAVEGGQVIPCVTALVPVLIGMVPGIVLGVATLLTIDPSMAKLIAGIVVIIVGGLTLFAPRLEIKGRTQAPIGVASGFLGGVLGGLAAMPGPIVFVYLLAKGLRGRDFTKETSMFLVLSATLLALILTSSRAFAWSDLGLSTAALAPVAVGMAMGQRVRDAMPAHTFKRSVLIVVLLSGAELVRKAIFA